MSYPMVHLKVAYGLLLRYGDGWIERPGDFLLGSVAPDAVHFHDRYDVSLKEKSHLWEFGPRGDISISSSDFAAFSVSWTPPQSEITTPSYCHSSRNIFFKKKSI